MPVVWTKEARRNLAPRRPEDLRRKPRFPRLDLTQELTRYMETEARSLEDTTFSLAMREPMLAASDEVREACKEVIRRAWSRMSVGQKTTAAWTFPDEAAWAHEAAEGWLAITSFVIIPVEVFYATVRDLVLVGRLWQRRLDQRFGHRTSRAYIELLETFGDKALPFLVEAFNKPIDVFDRKHVAEALALVDDPLAASCLAEAFGVAKTRAPAGEFFARFPHHAEASLGPLAAGRGQVATLARDLLMLTRKTRGSVTRAEAPLAELPEVFRTNPGGKGTRVMPPAWQPASFTRPELLDGRSLPLEAVENIGRMLATSKRTAAHPKLVEVKALCTARSLAELAWDCARAWEMSGAPSKAGWMRDALVHLADDEVVRRTTPAMQVRHVIPALIAIATPAAVMELLTIEARRRKWEHQVGRALTFIAKRHAMDVDVLVESLPLRATVRSAGKLRLGEQSAVSLRYGAQDLVVGFDARLEPSIRTRDGTRLKSLPKDASPDAGDAETLWRDLQEDVKALAPRLIAGLERAMVSGRGWNRTDFYARWLNDPIRVHLARAVLWKNQNGSTFRVTVDETFADSFDQPIELGDFIQVARAEDLSPDERERWRKILADYELISPIAQL